MPSSAVEVQGLSVRYGDVPALRDLSFSTGAGEFLAVVGPSGCGKTTLLRCLAGFVPPAAGRICFGGEVIADSAREIPPEGRGVGLVFQNYALWPHMTALDNVAYPWKTRGVDRAERRKRAAALLAQVGLAGLEQRRPGQLSGGQQQRVAIARALACEPRLLLLDEPLSNVDANLRAALQDLILRVARERSLTTIVATHDLDEAGALADRIAILRDGALVQIGTPYELNERPANGFVARFLGGMNVIAVGCLSTSVGRTLVRFPSGDAAETTATAPIDASALLCIRPEQVRLDGGAGGLAGVITRATYRAGGAEYRVAAGGTELRATEPGRPTRGAGDQVSISLGEVLLLPPEE